MKSLLLFKLHDKERDAISLCQVIARERDWEIVVVDVFAHI